MYTYIHELPMTAPLVTVFAAKRKLSVANAKR